MGLLFNWKIENYNSKMPKLVFYYFNFIKECGKSPFGQAPFLEVDGKVITQTGAIARYCGKLGGFYPKDDDFSAAKVDEIIDTATDITNLVGPTMRMGEAEKLEARKVL